MKRRQSDLKMKLSKKKRKEWNQVGLPMESLLAVIDRVYASPEIVAQRFFDTGTVKRIHISKRADLLVIKDGDCSVCVKYFHDQRFRVKLRTFLGLAKGRKGYRAGVKLRQAGVRVPEQLVCLEFQPFGPTVVVMELLEEIRTVAGWFAGASKNGRVTPSRVLIRQFAEFTADLHRRGIFHCDFSPRNVMVQGEGDALKFVLIDLEDIRFRRSGDRRLCIQNLARFAREAVPYVSIYTVMRFLSLYIRAMGLDDSSVALARQIQQYS